MAIDFGKTNRSVAFNPTSAFPLDARSYFESYEAAVAAAATAEPAGSTNSVYYFGQTIAVVEDEKATLYIIQPDNTLSTIGEVSIDTYTKAEIDSKIASAGHLKRKIVEKKEDIKVGADDADTYIYMVQTGLQVDDNKYNEYIVIDGEIEPVGSWEVNLSDYAKKTDLNTYATKDALVEYLKKGEAELNYINNVDTTTGLTYDSNSRTLSLDVGSYDSLKDALDSKISAQAGYGLISDADKTLLQQFKDGYIADVNTDELAVNNQKLSLSESLRETIESKAAAADVAAFKLEVKSSINTINDSIVWVDLKDINN